MLNNSFKEKPLGGNDSEAQKKDSTSEKSTDPKTDPELL